LRSPIRSRAHAEGQRTAEAIVGSGKPGEVGRQRRGMRGKQENQADGSCPNMQESVDIAELLKSDSADGSLPPAIGIARFQATRHHDG
jgi:hypothetical protein